MPLRHDDEDDPEDPEVTVAVRTPLGRYWHLAESVEPRTFAIEPRAFCGLPYSEGFDTVKQYRESATTVPFVPDSEVCLKCLGVRSRRRARGDWI